MLRQTLRLAALLAAFSPLAACTTALTPSTTAEMVETQKKAEQKPTGLVGLSAKLALSSALATPTLQLTFRESFTKETREVEIAPADLERVRALAKQPDGELPLLIALPAGRWSLDEALLRMPGGYMNGGRLPAQELPLDWPRKLEGFPVRPGTFVHVGHVLVAVKTTVNASSVQWNWETAANGKAPVEAVWQPLHGLLGAAPVTWAAAAE